MYVHMYNSLSLSLSLYIYIYIYIYIYLEIDYSILLYKGNLYGYKLLLLYWKFGVKISFILACLFIYCPEGKNSFQDPKFDRFFFRAQKSRTLNLRKRLQLCFASLKIFILLKNLKPEQRSLSKVQLGVNMSQ